MPGQSRHFFYLEAMPEMFTAVRSYDNYITANLMLQQVEEAGIKAYLENEYSATINPFLSNAMGGIKLMVFSEQAGRALDLLEKLEGNE